MTLQLVSVKSIRHTATEGTLDLQIVADFGRGAEEVGFTYVPGDNIGLSSQVEAWLVANPSMPIAPYEPPPMTFPAITKRQILRAMIIGAGATEPEAMVESAITAIADPAERALAMADWRHAPSYSRDHELFSDPTVLAALDMTSEQIDGLWAIAVQQPQ